MKVLFLYPDLSPDHARRFNVGVAQLASCLKQAGHQIWLYHYFSPSQVLGELTELVRHVAPDVLAYSTITNQMPNIRRLAQHLSPLGIYSILGGIHATLAPEESLDIPGINAVCRGEGDESFVEFLGLLERGEDITKVGNFWVKEGGTVHRNGCRPLIEDLDRLPPPDYELFHYDQLPEFTVNRSLVVAASRGCPYDCTYCCNHVLRNLYPNRAHYLRYKSPAATIRAIRHGLTLYPSLERVRFTDDTLSQKKEWFREFTRLYKTDVGLPYSTNDRCTSVTEEIVDLYAASGCTSVDLGIESGNPEIREKAMKRRMSDAQIERAFLLFKSRGINVNAFNILGMPGETTASLIDTLKINARVLPFMAYNAFFQPFPGTEARQMCLEQGLSMDEDFPPGFAIRPMVRLPGVSADELLFVAKFFRPLVRLYASALGPGQPSATHARLERILDGILLKGLLPIRLINRVYPTSAEFRLRHPAISRVVTGIVRKYRVLAGSRKRY